MKQDDVSVIIPAYGECPFLLDVVRAVLRQSVQPIEIIIVHSGTQDPSEKLMSLDERIRAIHREQRTFAGDARNIGLEHAQGKWIAFIDTDVLPSMDWLESLLAAVKEEEKRFVVGSVGYAKAGGYWGLSLWAIEFSSMHPYLPDGEIQGGGAGNMLISAGAIRSIGGFQPGLAASEDVVIAGSLRELGFSNWLCTSAKVEHFNINGIRHCFTHLLWLGRWGAICRRVIPLRGGLAVRFWPLAAGLWAIRLFLIYYRVLRWGEGYRLNFLALAPGVLLGLLVWNLGFLSGLRINPEHQPSLGGQVTLERSFKE